MRLPFALLPPDARPFDVVGFGQNSVDLVAVVPEFPRSNSKQRIARFARMPGGQVASAMVCCARLGWRTRYLGSVGADELATIGLDSLRADGVDVTGVSVVPDAINRFAIVLVDARTGDRTVLWDREPSLALGPGAVNPDHAASGRALLVDCEDVEAATAAARAARGAGVLTVIDIEHVVEGADALLRQIDVIVASEGFPERLTGEPETGRALAALAAAYRPVVACVTLGERGSLALCGGREFRTRGFTVPAADTTGAGDAFRGGFIAGCLAGEGRADVDEILTYANAVAALNCRAVGARAGMPRPAEVERLLATGAVL